MIQLCMLMPGGPAGAAALWLSSMAAGGQGAAVQCRACAADRPAPAAPPNANPPSPSLVPPFVPLQDSQYALRWTVSEVYRPGDVIHVVHCIPYLAVSGGIYAVPGGQPPGALEGMRSFSWGAAERG